MLLVSEEKTMRKLMAKFYANVDGATAIEYGLIAALVSVAAIGALSLMGGSLNDMFTAVSGQLDSAVTSMPAT